MIDHRPPAENNASEKEDRSLNFLAAHAFNVNLAVKYGLHIAVIFENIVRINGMNIDYPEYNKNISVLHRISPYIPYLTKAEIKRALKKMETAGLLGGDNE